MNVAIETSLLPNVSTPHMAAKPRISPEIVVHSMTPSIGRMGRPNCYNRYRRQSLRRRYTLVNRQCSRSLPILMRDKRAAQQISMRVSVQGGER